MLRKLKQRWNLKSNFQLIIILVVFTITGSSTVYVKKFIFSLIGVTSETDLLVKIPVYIVVILTVYNILLLIIGSIFGQFRFFWEFEKRFFSRFLFKRKSVVTEKVKVQQ